MMTGADDALPACPHCASIHVYADRSLLVCPECGHEWPAAGDLEAPAGAAREVRDAVGNLLVDGDSVTIVKDLKVKGASGALKVGTRIKGIRLIDGVDGHDIDCRVEGFGAMRLKSEFVKKA